MTKQDQEKLSAIMQEEYQRALIQMNEHNAYQISKAATAVLARCEKEIINHKEGEKQ